MAAGDIYKEQNLVVECLPVKSEENIEKGEVVIVNSGAVAAASTDVGPYYIAMQAFTDATYDAGGYTDPIRSQGKIMVCKQGYIEVQALLTGGAVEKGDYLEVSNTAGEVQLSDSTHEHDVVGVAEEAALTTDTTIKMTVGQLS